MERTGTEAEVIDMGLPSETVSGLSEDGHAGGKFPRPDLFERLDRVLRVVRPDVVLACYGMNCGIYQPLDDARFAKFKAGIERLGSPEPMASFRRLRSGSGLLMNLIVTQGGQQLAPTPAPAEGARNQQARTNQQRRNRLDPVTALALQKHHQGQTNQKRRGEGQNPLQNLALLHG
jgi:hypothetical protein